MPTFLCTFTWTESGIRNIKQTPLRRKSARQHAKLLNITIKAIYLTCGESDLLYILEAPDDESVAKFAILIGKSGNVRTRTTRAYTEKEFDKMLNELADQLEPT